jgi:isoquinoline 1-oxidoreductase beta subunit
MTNTSISRRNFLKGSVVGGLTLAVSMGPFGYKIVNAADKKAMVGFKPNAWFSITPDDKVTIVVGAVEMGQGGWTAQAMLIAEELGADWKNVEIRQGLPGEVYINPVFGTQLTAGSSNCRGFYEPLRKIGATGRAMLLAAAAKTWNCSESECQTANHMVNHEASGKTLRYGKLCKIAALLPVPQQVSLKKESEFTYLGKNMPRYDVPVKVSGKAVYGMDVKVKGLHYALLARPPAYGAKPVSFDEKAAMQVKGVKKVFPLPMGVAVCADSFNAAMNGRDALKVQWDKGEIPEMDDAYVEKSMMDDLSKPMVSVVKTGDAKKAISEGAKKLEANYYCPCVAHATMEPMNCAASVTPDSCEIWAPTQLPLVPVEVASKLAGVPKEKVTLNVTLLGCGLGRRTCIDYIVEAVLASKEFGKPVKVVSTREDDIKHCLFRAPGAHKVEAALDAQGTLIGWSHKLVSPSIDKHTNATGEYPKNGIDWLDLWGLADAPDSTMINNRIQYEIPNLDINFLISKLPIPVAPWRSVQMGTNAFVIESFMDELALAAGKDPLEFRLQNLKNNMRATRVLQTAAEKAGWGKSAVNGDGRGLAVTACFGSYAAQVADVSVDKKSGKIKVNKIVFAIDCGPVVNPGPLVEQIQGGVILALSNTLKEQVHFAKGGVKSANFDDYPIIRMSEVPEIEVHIIKSTDRIGGIGELGVPTTAPAVANAFFKATGVRIRRIPLDPATVTAALAKA